MIVLDIETTGLTGRNGIWQIGALELETGREFLEESKIDNGDEITREALMICGKTEREVRNSEKQSQKQMILNYLNWVGKSREKIFLGENIGWDISVIQDKCIKYKIEEIFRKIHGHRSLDLHTISQQKWKEIYGIYLLDENGRDKLGLQKTLEFCGIPDTRIHIEKGKVKQKGNPHNALDDCKLEAEVYFRLERGANLLSEYSQYKIPEILKKC